MKTTDFPFFSDIPFLPCWLNWPLLFLLTFFPLVACAESPEPKSGLIEETNFQQLALEMRDRRLPLMVEFYAEGCPYCLLLEEDFLEPMVDDPAYRDKILIRRVQLDLDDSLIDFQGKEVSASQFAMRYKAYLTPTLIFIDADGREVAEKIVGINTPSLFGGYLDIEIEKALNTVRAKSPSQEGSREGK